MKDKWKFPSQLEFFIIIIILSLVSVTCSNYDFKGICFPFVHNTGVVQFTTQVLCNFADGFGIILKITKGGRHKVSEVAC